MTLFYKTTFSSWAMISVLTLMDKRIPTMRTITVTEFLSLDGVMENPSWTFPYWNDETAQFKAAETTPNDVLLLGRVTYEGFAVAWPPRAGDAASGGVYFNGVRKYVV